MRELKAAKHPGDSKNSAFLSTESTAAQQARSKSQLRIDQGGSNCRFWLSIDALWSWMRRCSGRVLRPKAWSYERGSGLLVRRAG